MNPKTRSAGAFALEWVDSISIVDKFAIKITMKEPYAPFLANLTVQRCAIIPKDSEPTAVKPAPGTGPFVFKNFQPNETLELTRFDNYHLIDPDTGDQLPRADGIFTKKIPDETVRMAALRAGDIDFAEQPAYNIIADAKKNPIPGITVDYDMPGNNVIFFNVTKPPFDNKKVRQAVAHAINRKEEMVGGYWGLGQVLHNQPFPDNSRFYIPIQMREQNLDKARQLLAEAGYPNGFKCELFEFNFTSYLSRAPVTLDQLRKIGIEGTIKTVDRAPYFRALRTGDYGISVGGISERMDWDDAYYMYFHSSEIGKTNLMRYNNPELDKLVEQGRSVWDFEKRRAIYKKVVEILNEDVPIIYTIDSVVGYAYRDDLKGFVKGFATRRAFHGGGVKYWWIEKS
jgi:peptide/nickel transport system substrate-binding protein